MTATSVNENSSVRRVPAEPGKPVIDPGCWTADELGARAGEWIHQLSGDEIAGLEEMALSLRGRLGGDPNGLLKTTREDFHLGPFGETVARAKEVLKEGLGLFLIRGLPVEKWDRLDCATVYWGMGRHLGRSTPNNPEGQMFGHIADIGKEYGNAKHRGYQTNATMYFHVDPCDILTLLILQTAKSGGGSKLVSTPLLHNEIVTRRPDLARVLAEPFYRSRHGENAPGEDPVYSAPIFNYTDGYLSVTAGGQPIRKAYALPEYPDLSEIQIEALEFFDQIAEELHFGTDLEVGDIPIMNSHVNLHTRTGFEDWPEVERRRHAWRMWLIQPDIRPRTPYFDNWENGVHAPAQRIDLNAWEDDLRPVLRAS